MATADKLFARVEFHTSVARLGDLPRATAGEIAIAGRSNAGKSSAINALARRARLAHVSKTPGRTQLLNFFRLADGAFLVDLPGYGYARVPVAMRERWSALVSGYLQSRDALAGLVVVMDVRHPLTALDRQLLEWFAPRRAPIHVLLTKADKLGREASQRQLKGVAQALAGLPDCSVQLFSSVTGDGADEARRVICAMLGRTHRRARPVAAPRGGPGLE